MGCASSALLDHDHRATTTAAFTHHIVSLTSTTYGLLSLDPPLPRRRTTLASLFPASPPPPVETINSWDLMSGLDSNRISSLRLAREEEEDDGGVSCPPNGEDRVVVYTTTLRGVRKTFEDCNAVRSAIRGLGIEICERDVSMDRGFREELRELMKGKEDGSSIPPRVFVRGRYVGGADEVLSMAEGGCLGELLRSLPKARRRCDGCGGVRFLPCFDCSGSCKVWVDAKEEGRAMLVRCGNCNENGLIRCPICSAA
ncbi:hypothetical protein M569_09043 [Genlisea aurea]|uniref:Glutaredoxin domain-containing protein n=1 Tax=Genlisea aurea TaxID=192259 RepID=S8DRI7_9LAMI|nr:hypothetical protein M569_09043 [Genlisea aurea]